jgi:hypothetical protein
VLYNFTITSLFIAFGNIIEKNPDIGFGKTLSLLFLSESFSPKVLKIIFILKSLIAAFLRMPKGVVGIAEYCIINSYKIIYFYF